MLEHLTNAEAVLTQLHELTRGKPEIYCCIPNMGHLSVVERLLTGDFSYDDMGLLDRTHLRLFSPASAYKTFLDSGWLPNMVDSYVSNHVNDSFYSSLINTIGYLGVPERTARRNLNLYQMVLQCKQGGNLTPKTSAASARVGVIVPVTRKWEFELNVLRSPGIRELNAQPIVVQGASSAAEAFNAACDNLDCDWILFMHQDVYLPKGAGFLLTEALDRLMTEGVGDVPIGFAGLAARPGETFCPAGMVVDRTKLFSHGRSNAGISLDEFAVLLRKDSSLKIDASLGWHTWATDLCLQSAQSVRAPSAVVLEIPIFHNSLNDYSLPPAYDTSANLLLQKYPNLVNIPTLCGVLER